MTAATDTDVDEDLVALIDDFFRTECDASVVTEAERNGMPSALWAAADAVGLTRLGLPEDLGGAGGTVRDAVALLIGSGRHAVPLPLLESWLAGWALTSAGRTVDGSPSGFVEVGHGGALQITGGTAEGTLRAVGWGRTVSRVVALLPGPTCTIAVLDPAQAEIRTRVDLAGMPRDDLTFSGAPAEVVHLDLDRGSLLALALLGRAAQLAGAIDAAFALTRAYVDEREQFGRAIGTFQAVQHYVVTLAQASTTAQHVVERAALAASTPRAMPDEGQFEACAAKLVVSQDAGAAISAAHQAHGAIGMTQEYRLQQFTRRLMAWRADLGAESALAARLGETAGRSESLAHLITEPAPRLEPLP